MRAWWTANRWQPARPGTFHAVLMLAVGLAIGSTSACAIDLDGLAPPELPEPDRELFESMVQDILVQRCGNPTTCHGDETRPWAIFAPGANRLDPADLYYDFSLTDEETAANYDRTLPFTLDHGDGAELLTKPLARETGHVEHEGGDIFLFTDDREYRAIEAWINGDNGTVFP